MHGSRSKIRSKNLVRQGCAVGYNSGVKGLTLGTPTFARTVHYTHVLNTVTVNTITSFNGTNSIIFLLAVMFILYE
jgi:hypothetical protein